MAHTFKNHVHLITTYIDNTPAIYEECTKPAIDKAVEAYRLRRTLRAEDIVKYSEFFGIKVLVSRLVIDNEHFMPTTKEIDFALAMHAEYIIESAIFQA